MARVNGGARRFARRLAGVGGNVKAAGRLAERGARPAPRRMPAIVERIVRYLREVRTELSRVDWPTRKELTASTIIVVVVLIALSLYLGAWDWLFTTIVRRYLVAP